MERRVEDHFNTAGQRRHNEAWAGKLGAQKRTAALIRSSGAPVPAKLAKKIREDDVLSATETASSVSGYGDKDWASMRRGNAAGANRDEVDTERHTNDPDSMNYFDLRAYALQIEEAGYEVPSAEAVSQVAQRIARGDVQAEDSGYHGVVYSALMMVPFTPLVDQQDVTDDA